MMVQHYLHLLAFLLWLLSLRRKCCRYHRSVIFLRPSEQQEANNGVSGGENYVLCRIT